jgi:integrase
MQAMSDLVVVDEPAESDHSSADPEADLPGGWRFEMQRWLATLNAGRTVREYQKAITYFFTTPGVPQRVADLTFDLLLAYRGALARRATAHAESMPTRALRNAPTVPLLQGEIAGSARPPSILSPATCNIRLTALRQFLCHCRLFGSGLGMDGDHIRAALKRLKTERRRPYQILAEGEWQSFLAVAKDSAAAAAPHRLAPLTGPWGRTHADILDLIPEGSGLARDAAVRQSRRDARSSAVRNHAGMTGAQTAQRDYALVALFLSTGLRAIELASLDVGDLSREWRGEVEEWWLILPDSKTKGQSGGRVIPLSGELLAVLQDYLHATGRDWKQEEDRQTPLFLSQRRCTHRLSTSMIRLIIDRVEQQWLASGPGDARKISPHALRHSVAIALLEGNETTGRPPASVEDVRGWLGHLDIRTTQGYLAHLDARRTRRRFTL